MIMVKYRVRHGSRAFRPRKRAGSQKPTINYWPVAQEKRLLGFAGYKAGMTHFSYIDNTSSPNKGQEVVGAGTVVEVPPLQVFGVRAYDKLGNSAGDLLTTDEKILKHLCIGTGKKNKPASSSAATPSSAPSVSSSTPSNSSDSAFLSKTSDFSGVFVLCATQPGQAGFGKKSPDTMEIAVGGKDISEKIEYAKSLLGKTVAFSDAFKPGEFVDTVSITKGKGTQGVIKRFGVSIQRRKATGKRRHVGTLGPWTPSYVMYTASQAGQMGYHKRTDLNKLVVKSGAPAEINPKGGFMNYGLVKTSYVLLKGSISGPAKRLIRFRKAAKGGGVAPLSAPVVGYISQESKQ
ncbi:50S ribosomal protein L3 [Candidatus Parvarchaeota archaeon]|nr:50S ribosomal protein L3 [Candidatus Parvarchaeota archaeon]